MGHRLVAVAGSNIMVNVPTPSDHREVPTAPFVRAESESRKSESHVGEIVVPYVPVRLPVTTRFYVGKGAALARPPEIDPDPPTDDAMRKNWFPRVLSLRRVQGHDAD